MFLLEEAVAQISSSFNPYSCTGGFRQLQRQRQHMSWMNLNINSQDDHQHHDDHHDHHHDHHHQFELNTPGGDGDDNDNDNDHGGNGNDNDNDHHDDNDQQGSLEDVVVGDVQHKYGSESGFPSPTNCERKEDEGGAEGATPGTVQDDSSSSQAGFSREKGGVGGVIYPGGGFGNGNGSTLVSPASGAGGADGAASWGSWTTIGAGGVRFTSLKGSGAQRDGTKLFGSKVGVAGGWEGGREY